MDPISEGPGRHATTGAFRIVNAADPGPLPDQAAQVLGRLADAVQGALGEKAPGMIGFRFGHRVIVAPAKDPRRAVDVADVDLARGMVLTVGGADPTPEGALLAQLLFLRTDVMVGYVHAPDVEGPTMDLLQSVLPALRDGPLSADDRTVVLGKQPGELRAALSQPGADGKD